MPCRYLRQSSGQDHTVIRGPPSPSGVEGGGGAGVFAWPFLFSSQRSCKPFFSPHDRLYFHQALWTCIYFTHFPHISKKNSTPHWPPVF